MWGDGGLGAPSWATQYFLPELKTLVPPGQPYGHVWMCIREVLLGYTYSGTVWMIDIPLALDVLSEPPWLGSIVSPKGKRSWSTGHLGTPTGKRLALIYLIFLLPASVGGWHCLTSLLSLLSPIAPHLLQK